VDRLEISLDQALNENKVDGIVAVIYENERPMQGLAGWVDWRFRGLVSRFIKTGAVTGRIAECVYVPFPGPDATTHLVLIGGGHLSRYGKRGLISDEAFSALRKNLVSLNIRTLGISQTEFGGLNADYLEKQLKGAAGFILA
jgi:hypothetical protein